MGQRAWAKFLLTFSHDLLLGCPLHVSRTVLNDEECVCAIKQCASAACIDDSEGPMLDENIAAWNEFKLMRRMIELTGAFLQSHFLISKHGLPLFSTPISSMNVSHFPWCPLLTCHPPHALLAESQLPAGGMQIVLHPAPAEQGANPTETRAGVGQSENGGVRGVRGAQDFDMVSRSKESLAGDGNGGMTDEFERVGWESGRERMRDCRGSGDENRDWDKQSKRQRMLESNVMGVRFECPNYEREDGSHAYEYDCLCTLESIKMTRRHSNPNTELWRRPEFGSAGRWTT